MTPCDKCPKQQDCKTGKACNAFQLWLDRAGPKRWGRASRIPSERLYAILFRTDDDMRQHA